MADAEAGASAEAPKSVAVDGAINDGVENAPFEKAVRADVQPAPRRRRGDDTIEESFKYLDPAHPELESIYSYYNVHPSFPRERFLVRNPSGDPVKGIYTPPHSSATFSLPTRAVASSSCTPVSRCSRSRMFRSSLASAHGAFRLRVFQSWRAGSVRRESSTFTAGQHSGSSSPRCSLASVAPKGQRAGESSARLARECAISVWAAGVLRVHGKDDAPHGVEGGEGASEDESFEESITLPLWRSLHSLNLMLPKEERRAMLLRLYNEDVDLVNHTMKNDSSADATPAPAAAGSEDATLTGMSAEQDSLAAEDASRKAAVEVKDDELNQVAAAMPERVGEEDASNKTI